jgi:YndJ-like protein
VRSFPAQVLLLISSASSLPAMSFACIYAYSIVFKKLLIDIPQMAMTHGVINAFGFSLCGLIAWTIVELSGGRRS